MSFVSEIRTHYYPLNRNQPAASQETITLPADVAKGFPDAPEVVDDSKGPTEILRGDIAMAAVLLDSVGAKPDDFKSGVHLILIADRMIEGIKKAVERVSGREF